MGGRRMVVRTEVLHTGQHEGSVITAANHPEYDVSGCWRVGCGTPEFRQGISN